MVKIINMKSGGISGQNRIYLDKLSREAKGPVSTVEILNILGLPAQKGRRMILDWVAKGWLTRISKGLYIPVPLGAVSPESRKEDPWIVASKVFKPCYIGGWSACEHWGLTDQIFKDMIVFTERRFNASRKEIQGVNYIVKTVSKKYFFGLNNVWRGPVKILVSDPAKTIVDILNDPYIGGGIRNISSIIKSYFGSEDRNDTKLLEYLSKHRNRTIYKRLGYLIETLNVQAGEILKKCQDGISKGYSALDPDLPAKGKLSRKWNLRINAHIQVNNI